MCSHEPACPDVRATDCCSAHVVADQSGQGWCRLCNGIILFDDANTAFDHEADLQLRRLFHRLRQEGCALVLVSHRPSLLAMADHSYVLANGTLLAAPTPMRMSENVA